ncbi:chloride channel protein 2-like [Oppia nitens]|uniref:chloride channel protein 2-like n=1 Tax=Oppia nitens TaxID=1686743 RepID=UPI0023D9E864|nr:chloride channel protein 2-like [Oppia nitens]
MVLAMISKLLVRYVSPQAAGSGVGEMKHRDSVVIFFGPILLNGIFAATIGALFLRLLIVWFQFEDNNTHIFKTNFRRDHPYETLELLSFALLGVLSGISGYLFATLQRSIVLFNRKRSRFHALLQNYPLVYPVLVILILGLLSFTPGFGQYFGSWMMSAEQTMHELFNNETWGLIANQIDTDPIIDNWRTPSTSIYTLCSTLPVPAGLIVPSFKIGAGLGRFYGEWMAYLFPNGMNPYNNRTDITIIPGAYAVAGSAAFAGANTGVISSAVIIFEVTGQMTHLLPVLVAVIVAKLVAQRLGPSIYDNEYVFTID